VARGAYLRDTWRALSGLVKIVESFGAKGVEGSWLVTCSECKVDDYASDLGMGPTGVLVKKHRECFGLDINSAFDAFEWRNGWSRRV
jgi:hypothetical protein